MRLRSEAGLTSGSGVYITEVGTHVSISTDATGHITFSLLETYTTAPIVLLQFVGTLPLLLSITAQTLTTVTMLVLNVVAVGAPVPLVNTPITFVHIAMSPG